jgi:hypothetical protein
VAATVPDACAVAAPVEGDADGEEE